MARRSKKVARVVKPIPTPVHSALNSTYTTPISSAYPSAYPSEDESYQKPKPPKKTKVKPFRFLDLPPELRLKVYGFHFQSQDTIDLDPDNYSRIHKKMVIFLVCKAIYSEASTYFYHSQTFRLFPCHPGRFFKTKRPLLARLTPTQRADLSSLELRLGPGWNKPPRGWVVNDALGLADCINARRLRVFVECDPSDPMFNGFRRADGFYEDFCRDLLEDVLEGLPAVETIEFDAWESVRKSGDMMRGLLEVASKGQYSIQWGTVHGWTDKDEEEHSAQWDPVHGWTDKDKDGLVSSVALLDIGHGVWDTTIVA